MQFSKNFMYHIWYNGHFRLKTVKIYRIDWTFKLSLRPYSSFRDALLYLRNVSFWFQAQNSKILYHIWYTGWQKHDFYRVHDCKVAHISLKDHSNLLWLVLCTNMDLMHILTPFFDIARTSIGKYEAFVPILARAVKLSSFKTIFKALKQ